MAYGAIVFLFVVILAAIIGVTISSISGKEVIKIVETPPAGPLEPLDCPDG